MDVYKVAIDVLQKRSTFVVVRIASASAKEAVEKAKEAVERKIYNICRNICEKEWKQEGYEVLGETQGVHEIDDYIVDLDLTREMGTINDDI